MGKKVAKQRSRTKKPVTSLRSRKAGPTGGRTQKEQLRQAQGALEQYK